MISVCEIPGVEQPRSRRLSYNNNNNNNTKINMQLDCCLLSLCKLFCCKMFPFSWHKVPVWSFYCCANIHFCFKPSTESQTGNVGRSRRCSHVMCRNHSDTSNCDWKPVPIVFFNVIEKLLRRWRDFRTLRVTTFHSCYQIRAAEPDPDAPTPSVRRTDRKWRSNTTRAVSLLLLNVCRRCRHGNIQHNKTGADERRFGRIVPLKTKFSEEIWVSPDELF